MRVSLKNLTREVLEEAAELYDRDGVLLLDGLEQIVSDVFEPLVSECIGTNGAGMPKILDPGSTAEIFPPEIRQKLSRVLTPNYAKQSLLEALQPLLLQLLGPIVHVSSTFHAQFKGGVAKAVDHGGYVSELEYMEIHGPFFLHQDFVGASFPTSPSGITLWLALNTTPDWALRLYPGSHRLGLLSHKWLDPNDSRLTRYGTPIDIPARRNSGVLFNAMMLHGTGNPGPQRRVSCDIRFFPLCGFLPSETYLLTERPYAFLRNAIPRAPGHAVQAPLLEDLIFLGKEKEARSSVPQLNSPPRHCVLNWVNYLADAVQGNWDAAGSHLEKFVNTEIGIDEPWTFFEKLHRGRLHASTLRHVHDQLAAQESEPLERDDMI